MKRYIYISLLCALTFLSAGIQAQDVNGILYVKKGSTGDGSSWTNAIGEVADALRAAAVKNSTAAGSVKQIWVAKGTYLPAYRVAEAAGNSSRFNSFVLVKDTKLYGGFAGNETDTIGRDFTANTTILSGDIGLAGSIYDNAFRVVVAAGDMGQALISGFTISDAYGSVSSDIIVNGVNTDNGLGGGITVRSASLLIEDVTLTNNSNINGAAAAVYSAAGDAMANATFRRVNIFRNAGLSGGGGIYATYANVQIENTSGSFNTAHLGGGMFALFESATVLCQQSSFNDNKTSNLGGAIYCNNNAKAVFYKCDFLRDSCSSAGGAFAITGLGSIQFKNCAISACVSSNNAAAGNVDGAGAVVKLLNSLVTGNSNPSNSGIIRIQAGALNVINSTISGNRNLSIGGNNSTTINILNSIIYGNGGGVSTTGIYNTRYSTIQGATDNVTAHITSADPLFVSSNANSGAPFTGGDYRLQPTSPVVNGGYDSIYHANDTVTIDLAGRSRLMGTAIDQGAYELQLPPQSITALADTIVTYGDTVSRIFSASSGLQVTVASADNSVAEPYQDAAAGNVWKIRTKKAGTVNITLSQAGNASYAAATNVVFALTINKAALTVAAKDSIMNYTGTAFAGGNGITYSGWVNGDDSAAALTGTLTYNGTSQSAARAGIYTTIPGGLTSDKYTLAYVSGKLKIILSAGTNGILYVKKGSTGNGSSWANAVGEVADALRAAAVMNGIAAGSVKQIWVAKGTYLPAYPVTEATTGAASNTNRYNSFVLVKDTKLYGGFSGNETDTIGRDFTANATILSGDMGTIGFQYDNAFRVIVAAGDMGAALISGFTICDANSAVSDNVIVNGVNTNNGQGGGITVRSAALLIEDVILTNNFTLNGAGAAVYSAAGDVMANATFRRVNIFRNDSQLSGGGIYATYANVQLENTTGSFNSASSGSGMFALFQSATVYCQQSSFNDNNSYIGGSIYSTDNAMAIFYKCGFLRNRCYSTGGAFNTTGTSNVQFKNCSIEACGSNSYTAGVGYINGVGAVISLLNSQVTGNYNTADLGIIRVESGTLNIVNSTISGNKGTTLAGTNGTTINILNSIIYGNGGGVSTTGSYNTMYSTIQGATANTTTHITNADPLFVSSNDYNTAPFTGGDYRLQPASPVVNGGYDSIYHANDTISIDLAGNSRLMQTAIDQGAYELQLMPQAITALADTTVIYGDVFSRTFSASSGLGVTVASADNSIAEPYKDTAAGNVWKIKTKKAGVVNITVSQTGNTSYAAATDVVFALTIDKAALTVTANDSSKVYDGLAYIGGNGLSYSGFVNNEDSAAALTGAVTYSGTSQGAKNVNTYVITPVGLTAANYAITYADGTLTIDRAALTITAKDSTKTYDGLAYSGGNGLSYSGFVNSEDSTAALTGAITYSGTSQGAKNVNTYVITPGGLSASNYAITYADGTLTIGKAALTITARDSSKTYDGLGYSGGNGLSYSGFVNNEDSVAALTGAVTYSGTSQGAKSVSTYVITPAGLSASNYAITYADGTLTIGKATLTITAKDSTKTYDGVAYSGGNGLSYSGFVNNEDSVAALTGAVIYSGTSQGAKNVNTYVITPGGLSASNYAITYADGTLTIGKAALTITAKDSTKIYDGLAYSGGNGLSYSGFVNSEDSTAALTGAMTYSGTSQGAKNVNTYVITPGGLTASNYAITYADGTLTIGKAALTITARDSSKTYDGLGYSGGNGLSYSGFVNNEDSVAALTGAVIYSGTSQYAKSVSTYVITPGGLAATNYAITYADGTLTIGKAALTITARDSSKTYDGLAYSGGNGLSYSGFVNNEDSAAALTGVATYTGTAQGAKNVNTYVITPGGVTAGNYAITYINGTLSINKALVTVAAVDTARCYGIANPVFRITYSGLAGSETESVFTSAAQANVIATVQSAPGTYPITVAGAAADNYSFAYTNGALTVNVLPVSTINAAGGTVLCGVNGTRVLSASGNYSFGWLFNNTAVQGNTTDTLLVSSMGTYTAIATDNNGCVAPATNSVAVTRLFPAQPAFSYDAYCAGTAIQFHNETNTTNSGTVSYYWNSGDGQNSSDMAARFTYKEAGNYTAALTVTPDVCTSLAVTVTRVIAVEAPVVGVQLATVNTTGSLPTVLAARQLTNASYSWSPAAGLSNTGIYNPVATLNANQVYHIRMNFPSGCVTVDTLPVTVFNTSTVLVPNVFTPNGDGQNDLLYANLRGVKRLNYFRVFNRWGKKLFETADAGKGWDGRVNGELQPLATYIWTAEGIDENGGIIHRQGSFTLLR